MAAGSLVIDLLMKTGSFETDSQRAEAIVRKRTAAMKKEFANMAGEIKTIMAGLFAGVGVAESVGKLISVQREFDILNTSLETITGSSLEAQKQFAWITDFAAKTPYSVKQVAQAFIMLKNSGLDASEKSLRSYGDTASALGVDLMQVINAVSDAVRGDFERLKEAFYVDAKQMGDKVSLTFQGMTKTVGNNAKEISKYLTDIGNNNFSGNMEKRLKTLDGALSNLGESFNQFMLSISKSGVGSFFYNLSINLSNSLDSISKIINLQNAQNRQNGFNQDTSSGGSNWLTEAGSAISAVWETLTAVKDQTMAVSEGLGTAGNALLRGNIDDYITAMKMMDEDSAKIKKRMEAALDAIANYKTMNVPISKYDVTYPSSKEKHIEKYDMAYPSKESLAEVKKIYDETRTAAEKFAIEIDKLNNLYNSGAMSEELYSRAIEEAKKQLNSSSVKEGEAVYEKTRTAAEKLAIELEKLNKLKEQGVISEETYTRAVNEAQNTLDEEVENIKKKETEKQKAIQESRDSLYSGLLSEEESIRKSYERRRKEILTATEITDQERADLMTRLNENLVKQMSEFKEKDYWKTWSESAKVNIEDVNEFLSNTASSFSQDFGSAFEKMIFDAESFGDAMSTLAESMARSVINALGQMAAQWIAYQLVQKLMGSSTAATAATAQTFNALSSQQMAALNAYSSTAAIPLVGPELAPVAAAAAIAATSPYVATIASLGASAAAARAFGGPVMGNTPYLVGERGAELFVPNTSGAIVPNDKLGGGNITVNLIENTKKAGTTEQKQTNGRRELDVFVADLLGDGPRSKAIQRSFGLQRRGY